MPDDNPNFDWLTYETRFNQAGFKRPNGRYETHLYCLPGNEVIIWYRDGIDDDTVKALAAAFFPDAADALAHREESDRNWHWKGKGERRMSPATPQAIPLGIGPGCVLHAPPRVVLPYNEVDNDPDSHALGTKLFGVPLHGRDQDKHLEDPRRRSPRPDLLEPENHHWDMWRSASRSCVMRLPARKGAWPPKRWRPFPEGWNRPEVLDTDAADAAWAFGCGAADAAASTPHRLAEGQLRQDFSVKTGAAYVGKERQWKKDRIDGNWIVACLRSDYLRHMQEVAPAKDTDLVFLTELLTIAEREERPHYDKKNGSWTEWQRDGVQVRDLAPLLEGAKDGKTMYLPPLSIPFVGLDKDRKQQPPRIREAPAIDFATRTDEFEDICDNRWSDFWKEAWATLLGRAKALLLLRYALQSINPHSQNFLLEFGRAGAGAPWKSTGRLIVRDLQDTAIHRQAAWALNGLDDETPPTKQDDPEQDEHPLHDAFNLEVLNHEFGPARKYAQETGTQLDLTYPYVGTHLLWRRFSQFGKDDQRIRREYGTRIYTEGNAATVTEVAGARAAAPAAAADAQSAREARSRAAQAEVQRKNTFISRFAQWLEFRMGEWGLAHNRAYLHALEEALGHNFCVDWNALPDPQRPTESAAKDAGAPPAGDAGAWEDQASAIVDRHLGSRDGQKQIRAYRDRKWKALAPAVTLRVKAGGRACSYRKIALRRLRPDPKEWVDLTDQEGKVFLYQGAAADHRYRLDLKSAAWFELPRPGVDGTHELVWVEAPHPPPPPAAPASAPASASMPTAAPAPPAPAPASRAGLK
jgi:hypothetical protein